MKKIFLLGLIALMSLTGHEAKAQWGDYGVKLGIGAATMNDDLATKSPVFAANIGGYINYTFMQSESVLAEVFFLQTGLNLIRRGSNFEEHFEQATSLMVRTGYYHAWYLQLPILACVHYELPIRQSGHVVGFYMGPAVSFGLFGTYGDRRITPGVTSASANYDVNFNGAAADRQAFNHLNRFDISAVIGLSYEYKNFTLSLFLDDGFLATSEGDDILRIIENFQSTENKVNVKIPNGHNIAYMLSVGYSFGTVK